MTFDLDAIDFNNYSMWGLQAMVNRTERFLRELKEEIENRDDGVLKVGGSVIIFE